MSVYTDMNGTVARWTVQDGPLAAEAPEWYTGATATAAAGDVSIATNVDADTRLAWLQGSEVAQLLPAVGTVEITWTGADGEQLGTTPVERVGNRYCTRGDVLSYGWRNGDQFEELPPQEFPAAIQAAEETIEQSCQRSFTERAVDVRLAGGYVLEELPVQDARSISDGVLLGDRQCRVKDPGTYRVTYGSITDARIRAAATRLAAFYLRRRAVAENARGQSMDGVYVSYTLATGEEGAWTGIPYVDAVIEERRSRRRIVR